MPLIKWSDEYNLKIPEAEKEDKKYGLFVNARGAQ